MTIPVELSGQPPLATRYAVGRLIAPDAFSLSRLITAAALREEVARDIRPSAVIVEAAAALERHYLPEAKAEAEHLDRILRTEAGITVRKVTGPGDRDHFLAIATDSTIVHFCGHGRYSDDNSADSGLLFHEGLLRPDDIPFFSRTAPIVFANACESVAVRRDGSDPGRAARPEHRRSRPRPQRRSPTLSHDSHPWRRDPWSREPSPPRPSDIASVNRQKAHFYFLPSRRDR